jgi:hypothetical protein
MCHLGRLGMVLPHLHASSRTNLALDSKPPGPGHHVPRLCDLHTPEKIMHAANLAGCPVGRWCLLDEAAWATSKPSKLADALDRLCQTWPLTWLWGVKIAKGRVPGACPHPQSRWFQHEAAKISPRVKLVFNGVDIQS